MITQTQTTSFKRELYEGVHNFLTDTFHMALYGPAAVLGADTAVYTTQGEIVQAGYIAGGTALSGVVVGAGSGVAWVNFSNAAWPVPLSAAGALIYNTSKGNKTVAVLDFGAVRTSTTPFVVVMPPTGPTSSLIRSN